MKARRSLEGLADVLARQLLSWLHRRVEPGSREWLDALTAESEYADNGWQRLSWALGALPLVWSINKRRRMDERARGATRTLIVSCVANTAAIVGGFALIIPATRLASHVFRCHLFFGNQSSGCSEHPFVFATIAICGGVFGVIIALASRARFAAYWWAVISVCNTVGSVWYLRSGFVDVPRYVATQSAMLMAATLGVALAAIMREAPWTETDFVPVYRVGDTVEAPASLLSPQRITALFIAGTISFAMTDSLVRMRDLHLVADNVNHYAVLGSAMISAIVAGLIHRHWSQVSTTVAIVRL